MADAGHSSSRRGGKSADAFRTISEVADDLDVPQHVLRFWETKFTQVRPLKRGGGRRYYRPEDVELLRSIRALLYTDGYTIKGVQKLLREGGVSPREDGTDPAASADPTAGASGDAPSQAPAAAPQSAASPPSGGGKTAPETPAAAPPRAAGAGGLDPAKRQALSEILSELEALKQLLQPK